MTAYRCLRNPDGIRVGQTWYAKVLKNSDADKIEITAVFGKEFIHVKTNEGRVLQTNECYLKATYSLDDHDDLFGDTQ